MAGLVRIAGQIGSCGAREVFIGFAPAALLYRISVADVLNEATGQGYQRRFNRQHSLDFRRYIREPGATSIPLTFNLRPRNDQAWAVTRQKGTRGTLALNPSLSPVMYQVDCQHRLGFLSDIDTEFPFMSFIGLDEKEEMEVFGVINGKAKGLSTSLLDYHEAQLARDLKADRAELFIALQLHEDDLSPWHKQLDLGGTSTTGLKRRASLRTMQKAAKRFLQQTKCLEFIDADNAYLVIRSFWRAVSTTLAPQWNEPRKHFLTKGIGVYSLSTLAADLFQDSVRQNVVCDESYFVSNLYDFLPGFDWSNTGPLRGLGGESGVSEAVQLLRTLRASRVIKVVGDGK